MYTPYGGYICIDESPYLLITVNTFQIYQIISRIRMLEYAIYTFSGLIPG